MPASSVCEVRVRLAWWLIVYLYTVIILCRLFECEPNWERVEFWLRRGITIRPSGARPRPPWRTRGHTQTRQSP